MSFGYVSRYLKDSDGPVLDGVSKTASFDSEEINVNEFEWFGLYLRVEEDDDSLLGVDLEGQLEDGVWHTDWPGALDTETGATMGDINPAADPGTTAVKFWQNFMPIAFGDALVPRLRFEFDLSGSNSAGITITAILMAKRVTRATDM